ncbi:homeobox-like resistance [Hordeum vulgare]|nr:homeobox-like resistance [Hordeum vulgare]
MTGQTPRIVFRFTHTEVAKMEEVLRDLNAMPKRPVIQGLTDDFNSSPDRSGDGKVPVQYNQVRNWFQNRRSAQSQRTRGAPPPQHKMMMLPTVTGIYSGNGSSDNGQVQFEAKSASNGEWYDVAAFLSHRFTETKDPEVQVRFSWLGPEEDEWVDVCKCVRPRSLQCVALLPGDLILCSKGGKEQAAYFDAHVLEVQRRRHDVRGCRCRFLVCNDHDHSEEIIPLTKVCRRRKSDNMHQTLHARSAAASADAQKAQKMHKITDENTDKVTGVPNPIPRVEEGPSDKQASDPLPAAPTSTHNNSVADVERGDAEAAPNANGEAENEAHGDKVNFGA